MSKLDELIQQYCPDGVEYHLLGNIASIKRGERVTKAQLIEHGQYPVISGGIKPLGYLDQFNRAENTITIAQYGTAGYIDWQHKKFWANDVCYSILPNRNINNRFLYYALLSNQGLIYSLKTNAIPACLPIDKLSIIEIHVPPLPVQEEIVRILDKFTELQAELQAELQKRKQQYNYYLDNLLNFNRGGYQAEVRWMKMSEVATQWYRGAGIKKEEVSEEGMPCIRYGEIHTTYNIWFDDCISHTDENKQATRKYADKGDILFAITSEDIPFIGNSVAYLGNERILVGGDIVVMKHNQDPKYIAYALSTSDAIRQKGKGKVKSKVVHTNVPSLQEIVIPIPSMAEQKKIAGILDRFDHLTNDLSSGLPAEIEKRRRQYEYYRDKLLSFKRKNA